jgi:hypothetical protein
MPFALPVGTPGPLTFPIIRLPRRLQRPGLVPGGQTWARARVWHENCSTSVLTALYRRQSLERVMHVERSARCMDVEMKRHPGVRRDPDPGGRLDSRRRGNDH